MTSADFDAAHDWLLSLIRDPQGTRYFTPRTWDERQARLRAQLPRLQAFLAFCGHPERRFRSVHIAGTSGKGSVTLMLSALLTAAGQHTGDHVSPYLQIPNEKLRVDGQPIAPSAFIAAVADLRARLTAWQAQGGDLRYGEAWVALTFLWLAQQQVDWAVIETGMGGRYDPTNALPSSLAVITNIDYDHTQSLGDTLEAIAWHKAGIIKPGGTVLTGATQPEVLAVIAREAQAQGATLIHVPDDGALPDGWLPDGWHGFQRSNATLAVSAARRLAERHGWSLTSETVRATLRDFVYPGRLEVMQTAPTVILDGAHNPHKVASLVRTLQARYPQRRMTVVLGLIMNKEANGIIDALRPVAARFVLTEPRVFGKPPVPAATLAALTAPIPSVTEPDVDTALDGLLAAAQPDDMILVTGSIYLIGAARERWFPRAALLRQLEGRLLE